MVAFDIDGTLIRSDGSVSPRVRAALQMARTAGAVLAISTGRPWPQARSIVEAAGGMHYGVCLNGAVVVDASDGAQIALRAMPPEQAKEAGLAARRVLPGVSLAADMADGRHFWEHGFDPLMPIDVDAHRVHDAVAAIDGPVLTWLVGTTDHDPDLVMNALRHHLPVGTEIRPSGLDIAEIAAHGVSKASGLQILADRHGLRRDEVMAFGDGLNDLEMLRWVGVPVAMANGHATVQGLASQVAPSNDLDGVAVVLESYFGIG